MNSDKAEPKAPVDALVSRPCPFCGKNPQVGCVGAGAWYVFCDGEICEVKPETPAYSDPDKAVKIWNGGRDLFTFSVRECDKASELIDRYGPELPVDVFAFLTGITLLRVTTQKQHDDVVDRVTNAVDLGIRKSKFGTYDELQAVIEAAIDG